MTVVMSNRRTRLISVAAATVIALACGTNYVYSAWAPQFAQRLKLSSTETNLVGTMGNLGMYATGIPTGILIDARGPRWGVAIGIVLFGAGYYPIAKAFDAGPGVYSVASLCLFSFFTGAGSCSAFTASIKAAALNFPDHRGTATGLPLAAFGLSAFFFATLALALPHDTSHFLLLLATGTVVMPILSFPFLNSGSSKGQYEEVPQHVSERLHRTSRDDLETLGQPKTGTLTQTSDITVPHASTSTSTSYHDEEVASEEHSSLLSTPGPGTPKPEPERTLDTLADAPPPDLDIRGMQLVRHKEFWLLFALLGLMCGIGLMTINNIGAVAQALWKSYDPTVPGSFIAQRQVLHVSLLSVSSFSGRLLSGIGSDVLVRKYQLSRFWCLLISTAIFILAQLCAMSISNPNFLVLVSGLTGLAYGVLFGVYPSIVAHYFGVHGLSQNWNTCTLAPVISGNIFNLLYGSIYDAHSVVDDETGTRVCLQGRSCYRSAYFVTLLASIGSMILCLYCIWYDNQVNMVRRERIRRKSVSGAID